MRRLERLQAHLRPAPAAGGADADGGEDEVDWVAEAGRLRATGLPGPDSAPGATPAAVARELGGAFFVGEGHRLLQDWGFRYGQGSNIQYSAMELSNRGISTMIQCTDPRDAVRLLNRHMRKAPGYEIGVLREGVLSQPDPAKWAAQRARLKPAFSTASLARLVPVMEAGMRDFVARLRAAEGAWVEAYEEVSHLTFRLIGHAALGESSEFLDRRAHALRDAFDVGFSFAKLDSPEAVAAEETIQRFCSDVVANAQPRRAACPHAAGGGGGGGGPVALIDLLVQTDARGCPALSRAEQRDELTTFQFAGHDTTGNTLCWVLYELARAPAHQRALQAELDRELRAVGARELQYKDLSRFRFLTKCINETLRKWPPVAAGTYRQLECDEELHRADGSAVRVPRGALVHFSPIVLHHNPALWPGPPVDEWAPERPWNAKAFIPFMRGRRDCLGRNLAMLEMRVVLARLLHAFDVELHPEDAEQTGFYMATVRPARGGLRMRFTPRA